MSTKQRLDCARRELDRLNNVSGFTHHERRIAIEAQQGIVRALVAQYNAEQASQRVLLAATVMPAYR